jgi:DNA-binding transcriptional regulator YhcF (GntR family)
VGEPAVDAAGAEKQPRYVAIKDSIFEDIREGRLKPGDQTPSEAELVETFKVSRMTANRALRELQSAGVVVRRAGRGSFVAEPRPIGQLIEIRNIAEEVRGATPIARASFIISRYGLMRKGQLCWKSAWARASSIRLSSITRPNSQFRSRSALCWHLLRHATKRGISAPRRRMNI